MTNEPMKVRELIAHLQTLDQEAAVFIYCVDEYYNVAVTKDDIREMNAFWRDPYSYTIKEDAYGKPIKPQTYSVDAHWTLDYLDGNEPPHTRKLKAICFHAE